MSRNVRILEAVGLAGLGLWLAVSGSDKLANMAHFQSVLRGHGLFHTVAPGVVWIVTLSECFVSVVCLGAVAASRLRVAAWLVSATLFAGFSVYAAVMVLYDQSHGGCGCALEAVHRTGGWRLVAIVDGSVSVLCGLAVLGHMRSAAHGLSRAEGRRSGPSAQPGSPGRCRRSGPSPQRPRRPAGSTSR